MTVESAAKIIRDRACWALGALGRMMLCAVRVRHQQCTQGRKSRDRRFNDKPTGNVFSSKASTGNLGPQDAAEGMY
jgi:hypothetical protein